jgi:hypothetical protein
MTQYAYVDNGQIESVGPLPVAARRQDTSEWVMGLRDAPVDLQQATGWYEVADTARPADTPTTCHTRTVELVAGTPTEVWTAVAKTPEEQAAEADEADREADAQAIRDDLPTLKDERDQAAVLRDDATLELARMTEGDPEYQQVRWGALREDWDETIALGEIAAALNDLAKKTRFLQLNQRKQWSDLRAGFGNDRSLAAALIRKFRKDRDDQ